jgi:hypothetical protein
MGLNMESNTNYISDELLERLYTIYIYIENFMEIIYLYKTMDWVDNLPIVKKSELFFSFFTHAWIKGYKDVPKKAMRL